MILWCLAFDPVQDRPYIRAERAGKHHQLYNVDATLAAFDAGDKGLMALKPCGKVGLCQPGRLSGVDEGLAQRLMAGLRMALAMRRDPFRGSANLRAGLS